MGGMRSKEDIEREYAAIRAERIRMGGDDLGYDKGHIDGMHIALAWVLDALPTAADIAGLMPGITDGMDTVEYQRYLRD